METMTAAVCLQPGQIVIEDVEIPRPGPGEALIEVKASGICGSDVRGFQGTHPEIDTYPVILGHEFAGVVAEVGKGVAECAPGDRAIIEPLFVCGKCPGCLAGDYHLCQTLTLNGHREPGSFARYAIVPARFVHAMPDGLSFEQAAMAEPLAVCVHAAKRLRPRVGDLAVVLGAGPIGLLMMQVLKVAGCRLILSDVEPFKLELAQSFGAEHVVNARDTSVVQFVKDLTGGWGADVAVECAGAKETLAESVEVLHKGGTALLLGFTGSPRDEINLTNITITEKTVMGSVIYCRDFPVTIHLMANRQVQLDPLITHRFPLADTLVALQTAAEKKDRILKGMIIP